MFIYVYHILLVFSIFSIFLPFFQGPPWLPCGSWTWPALFRPSERRIRSQKSLRRNLYGTAGQFFSSGSVNLGLYPWGICSIPMPSTGESSNFPDEIGRGHHNHKQTHFADRFEAFAAAWARWSVLRSTGLWTILDLCFNVKGIHWKATHQSSSIFQIHYSRFSQGEGWSRRLLTAKQPIRNVRSSGNPFPVELSSKQPGKKPVAHWRSSGFQRSIYCVNAKFPIDIYWSLLASRKTAISSFLFTMNFSRIRIHCFPLADSTPEHHTTFCLSRWKVIADTFVDHDHRSSRSLKMSTN